MSTLPELLDQQKAFKELLKQGREDITVMELRLKRVNNEICTFPRKANKRLVTNFASWEYVYYHFDVLNNDLVFCFMKCGTYRAGRAKDQDWPLVESFIVVERS